MQPRDRRAFVPQRRDLADHEHAFTALLVLVDLDQPVVAADEAAAGEPEAPEVELFELLPALLLRQPGELGARLLESVHIGRLRAPDRVAGRGFQQRGVLALQGDLLERRPDRAVCDGFLGEQVRRADENADRRATRRQGPGHGIDHRGRAGVVNAAREQRDNVLLTAAQNVDLLLPQREAGSRTRVAAALRALEDELARALVEEPAQQRGRRHVQERLDPGVLQLPRLGGRTSGDDRVPRLDRQHRLELLRPQLRRREAEQADTPRQVAELRGGRVEELAHRRTVHQREREERQRATFRDRRGERGLVADTGHRALRDRVAQPRHAVAERTAGPDRAEFARLCDIVPNGAPNRADDASDGPKRDAIEFRERAFLTNFERVPTNMHTQAVVHDGVGAVHRADRVHNFSGNMFSGLGDERELAFQHHSARPTGDGGGSRVRPDRSRHPDRQIGDREHLLEQHERGRTSHPAARLGALRDQPGHPELDRRNSLGHRGDHGQHATFTQLSQVRERANKIHDNGVDGVRQGTRQRPVQTHPERALVTRRDMAQVAGGVRPKIEHAESARSFGRDHEGRVRGAERTQTQHPISIRQHVHCARFLTVQGVERKEFSSLPTRQYVAGLTVRTNHRCRRGG